MAAASPTVRQRLPALGPRSRFAVAAFIGQAAFAAIAFVGSVATARILGPDGRGALSAWTVTSMLVALVLSGAYPNGLARAYLVGRRGTVIPTAAAHTALAAGLCVVGAAVALLAGPDRLGLVLFIVVAAPLTVFTNDLLILLTAAKKPWSYHLPRIAGGLVFSGGAVVVYFAGGGDRHVIVWSLFVASALAGAALFLVVGRRLLGIGQGAELRKMWRLGKGSWFASVTDFLLLRCDQLLLVVLVGPVALGIYAVSVNVSEVGQYLGNSIGQGLFEDETTLGARAAQRIFRLTALAVGGLCLLVGIVGWLTVVPLFGDEFSGARTALLLLLPGIVARAVGWAASQMLFAREAGPDVSSVVARTFAVALPLWVAGALLWDVNGIAAASAVVYCVQMVLMVRRFHMHESRVVTAPRNSGSGPP
jgi:O-antigen/teichoic acid export membrane protein